MAAVVGDIFGICSSCRTGVDGNADIFSSYIVVVSGIAEIFVSYW